MFSVKFKVKDGRNSLPRSSSRSSVRSTSPAHTRKQYSRSADRSKVTKIARNGHTVTTVVDGKLSYGNCSIHFIFHSNLAVSYRDKFIYSLKLPSQNYSTKCTIVHCAISNNKITANIE